MRESIIIVFGRGVEIGSPVTLTGLEFTVVKDDLASDSRYWDYGCTQPYLIQGGWFHLT